jgi:hypothetical protein
MLGGWLDFSFETTSPRNHGLLFFIVHHLSNIIDNIDGIVAWYRGAPT